MMIKRIVLCLFALFSAPLHSFAVNRYATGAELGSATAGMEWNTNTGSNHAVVTSPAPRTGTYCMKSSGTAQISEYLHRILASDTVMNVNLSAWIYIEQAPSGIVDIMRFENAAGSSESRIRLNTNRTLECWTSVAQLGSDSTAVALNTWTQIGFTWDETTNTASCYLSGSQFATGLSNDLGGGTSISWGFQAAITGVVYFDDIIWNDDQGTNNNALPTTEKLVYLRPNGAGDTITTTVIGGTAPAATIWESVDEITPDDAVTFATMTAASSLFDVAMENASVGGIGSEDTVKFVAFGLRGSAASAASATYIPRMKSFSGGVISSGTTTTHAVATYWTNDDTANTRIYQLIAAVAPQTAAAWTSSDIDGLQLRTATSDATPNVLVTTVWALVAFIDNAAAGNRRIMVVP